MADPNLNIKISATNETRAAFEAVQAAMKKTEVNAAAMGASVQRSQAGFRSFGNVTQQAGYQVQDFATQVAGGTSALVAFGQQAPQFLGIFGAGGAIAGAAIAAGVLALRMFDIGAGAKGAADEVGSLAEAIAKLNEESAKRGGGVPGIRGNVRLEDLMSERARLVGMLPSGSRVAGAADEMTAFVEAQSAAEVGRIQGQIDAIDKLIREYDRLTMEQEAVAQSTANLKTRGEEFEAARRAEQKAIEDARRQMEEYQRAIEAQNRAIAQTVLSLDPVEAATQRYNQQLDHLGVALSSGTISQERYNDLVREAQRRLVEATDKVDRHAEALDRQADALRQQLDPMAAYEAELVKLNELLETGRISTDEYAQAADRAWQRVSRTQDGTRDIARDLGLTFNSAFEDAILKGEKLRGVLAGIAQDLARMIARRTITEPLGRLATSALGGLGGLLFPSGSVGAALGPVDLGLPGFADGGPVSGGRPVVVGEEGPEIFVPRAAGQIVPNGQGVGGTVVNQTINISVGVAQTVRAELAALMPAIKRQTVDAVANARMRGGSFASAMGT